MGTKTLIASYLFAIVTANLVVTQFGQIGLLVTGFILIPFDLFSRDLLHEKWKNKLALKMSILILSGSFISYILNADSGRIAIASMASFALTGLSDTLIYQWLQRHSKVLKMNASNIGSSLVDSLIFPWIAFGFISIELSVVQWSLKFFGAMIWIGIYNKSRR